MSFRGFIGFRFFSILPMVTFPSASVEAASDNAPRRALTTRMATARTTPPPGIEPETSCTALKACQGCQGNHRLARSKPYAPEMGYFRPRPRLRCPILDRNRSSTSSVM